MRVFPGDDDAAVQKAHALAADLSANQRVELASALFEGLEDADRRELRRKLGGGLHIGWGSPAHVAHSLKQKQPAAAEKGRRDIHAGRHIICDIQPANKGWRSHEPATLANKFFGRARGDALLDWYLRWWPHTVALVVAGLVLARTGVLVHALGFCTLPLGLCAWLTLDQRIVRELLATSPVPLWIAANYIGYTYAALRLGSGYGDDGTLPTASKILTTAMGLSICFADAFPQQLRNGLTKWGFSALCVYLVAGAVQVLTDTTACLGDASGDANPTLVSSGCVNSTAAELYTGCVFNMVAFCASVIAEAFVHPNGFAILGSRLMVQEAMVTKRNRAVHKAFGLAMLKRKLPTAMLRLPTKKKLSIAGTAAPAPPPEAATADPSTPSEAAFLPEA
jgi:hypothetical protein